MPAEYEPTAEQRALVESASAIGITQAEIANQLKIDEKTLRKHRVEDREGHEYLLYKSGFDPTASRPAKSVWPSRASAWRCPLPAARNSHRKQGGERNCVYDGCSVFHSRAGYRMIMFRHGLSSIL